MASEPGTVDIAGSEEIGRQADPFTVRLGFDPQFGAEKDFGEPRAPAVSRGVKRPEPFVRLPVETVLFQVERQPPSAIILFGEVGEVERVAQSAAPFRFFRRRKVLKF